MSLSAVEKLIEQRRLFQDWLTKLASDVEGMPPHVVARVRNDYKTRLDGVVTELGEHGDALREALDEAQLRHDGLDTQVQAKKDELSELRLRRHVGEMDELAFKETSGSMKAALDGIQKELAAALRDIERYEEILDVITADLAPVEDVVAAAPPPPPPPPPPPAPAPKAEAPAPEAPREPRKSSPEVAKGDELAFLRSVTTPVSAIAAAKAAAQRPAEKPAPPEEKPAVREEQPAAVAQAGGETLEAAPHMLKMPASEYDEPEAPAAAPAKPAAKEDAALVCGECGATNRPTEWYCEKCGAELAAF
jgi:hypothetical protein